MVKRAGQAGGQSDRLLESTTIRQAGRKTSPRLGVLSAARLKRRILRN